MGGLLGGLDQQPAGAETGPQATKGSKPRHGGTIHLGSTGGSSSDTLDANNAVNNLDFARSPQLYECLLEWDSNAQPVLGLAEELTPNKDATEWTIRVKKGIEFHNGKELTSDDVIFTFQRIVKNDFSGASILAYVDVKNLRKVDRYTLAAPTYHPFSIMDIAVVGEGEMSIVPVGYDPKKPVGTGAFKYESFTPGVQSTFTRNPNYWRSGQPYVDEVVITDYTDETSQDNALLAGDITCADQLSAPSIATLRAGGVSVDVWKGPGWIPFTMRVDTPPFNDVNVRQALRLVIDRTTMREVVYGGYGWIGNDIFGITDPEYDHAIPQRHQDIDRAKYLLKKAGKEKLTTTLVTAPIHAGAESMATVLKEQAALAGITINLKVLTDDGFFVEYLKWAFSQDWWDGYPYLSQVAYSMVPTAPWDETHWPKSPEYPRYASLYTEALKTLDKAKQKDIVHEMMEIDWNYGGYIIPVFNPVIAAQSSKLDGVVFQRTATPWINYYFRTLWFKS